MEEKQPPNWTPEQRRTLGIHLDSLMAAPVPNLKEVREAVKSLPEGIDPKEAYETWRGYRSPEVVKMPTFEDLMGE